MTIYETIIAAYPELAGNSVEWMTFGSITLRDDSDGKGEYIDRWEYSKPLPAGLKLGK
jgi:hypothetical protein